MLPAPPDGMMLGDAGRVGRVGRAPRVLATVVMVVAWLGCSSPESFRPGQGGLTTGGAGAPGQAGAPGSDAGALAGDNGAAGTGTGIAGDSGAAGIGAAGAGVAGTGAAGSGVAGTGTAGAGAAGSGAAGSGAASSGAAGSGAAGSGAAGSGAAGSGAAGSGAAGSGAAGAAATGAGGAPGGTGGAPPGPLALPMTVSDHFVPTGGMGDGAVAGSVTIGTDTTACAGEPAAANKGACYTITYHPQPIVAPATSTWGGFYWQYPDNNWGAQQPLTIASGAKDISFYAKGMAGGEAITFQAGGILNTVSTATPYTDAFTVRMIFNLTTTWTKYTIPMTGLTYGGVLGGFAWVAAVPNQNPVTFFVHGIVWE